MIARMMMQYEGPTASMGRLLKLRHDIDLYEKDIAARLKRCCRQLRPKDE